MDDQLLSDFLAEADDIIGELHGDTSMLRARRSDGRARRELVGRIFRRVHTIKGTSSAAGLTETSGLAHELETLLDAVRLGRAPVDDDFLEAAEDAFDAFAASLRSVAQDGREIAAEELIGRLRRLASSSGRATRTDEPDAEASLPANVARTLGEYERQRLRETMREGARAYVVMADFDVTSFDEEFRRLSDALGEFGETVASQPSLNAAAPNLVSFRIIYASADARDVVGARVARLGARLCDDERPASPDDGAAEDTSAGAQAADEQDAALQSPASALTVHVRVPLDALDALISAAHDLFADAAGALELALANEVAGDRRGELETRAAHIRRRFFDLEEELRGLRTVTAYAALGRAARIGLSVARSSGKQVEFETSGGDMRLDKSLADALADPLLHLVRNAVAHGIETADERRAAGKPERGRVRLEAFAEGGSVVLRVSDDGRGVNTRVVAEAASERGLIAPGTHVSDAQALRLIFLPGFSTVARASSLSGRGVGLDVVERAVKDAGGEVRARSEHGRGATFEMRLPVTTHMPPPETRG